MTYVATYIHSYWFEGSRCGDERFVESETMGGLFVEIGKIKFQIEFGCYEPESWQGHRSLDDGSGSSVTEWRVFQEFPCGSMDAKFDPADLPTYKDMVARAEAAHGARLAKQLAERTARQEIEERETLKALQEKYGNHKPFDPNILFR